MKVIGISTQLFIIMENQNTSNSGFQSVTRLLAFQYKLANALKNRSIDSFSAYEKRVCHFAVELYTSEYDHESIQHFLLAFSNPTSDKYLVNAKEITFEDFDNHFVNIDDLLYAAWQEIINHHEKVIHNIKQQATKHEFPVGQGDYPDGIDPELYDI